MAEMSGFFNALLVDNQYDRKYNANDYSDNLAVVIGNGVLRSVNDDLKCTAEGMVVSVGLGRAWINGHYYLNDTEYTFAPTPSPVGGKRYDRVMLRLDKSLPARRISLVYVQGTESANPTKPAPTRANDVYDLVLADVLVTSNSANVEVSDTRADAALCGWVYSTAGDNAFFTSLDTAFNEWFTSTKDNLASVTLFKRYTWQETLTVETNRISFNIPQYDSETSFLEVYVNGILDKGFTQSGNVLTFDGRLIAGTTVTINCFKSIDGTGIMSVADEITVLQNQIDAVIGTNKFVYNCTGLDDNVALSEIAQAIYSGSYVADELTAAAKTFLTAIGGNTYLSQLPAEAQVEIDVVGKLGATTPVAGSGTTESRYRWFNLGVAGAGEKKVVFNFSKCQKITIAASANTNNIIFYGTDLNLRSANVYAYSDSANCVIAMIAGSSNAGNINCDDCRFSISTSGNATIAENGNFTNCYCILKSTSGNAICFNAKSTSLVRLVGGTFYAYIGATSNTTAIMNIESAETNAVIIAHNINVPTVSLTGFTQRNLAIGNGGSIFIDGVVCTMNSAGTTTTIQGQIWKSKR